MKYIIDIQDLWPEAFFMVIKNKWLQKLFWPFTQYVNRAYEAADGIVAVSQTYVNRALSVNNKTKQGVNVFLGNDGALFEEGRKKHRVERKDNEIWLCYIGSMSHSYDIHCVIDALAILKARGINNIRFIAIGRGEKFEEFKHHAQQTKINFDFVGSKPYPEMVGLMCSCDIVINPIVKGSAASIINKVGDYAMSGLPVINSQECIEYRNLVEKYNCGINVKCGDASSMADAIELLVSNRNMREEMGTNSLRLAQERFDRRYTYKQIVNEIEHQCGNKKNLNITILANFPSVLNGGKVKGRFLYLGEMLAERGHNVEMVISDFSHGEKKHREPGSVSTTYKTKITIIHEPGYRKNISIKRLYSHWIWGKNVGKYLKTKEISPDCIYCAIPSITVGIEAAKYCSTH